MNKEVMLLASGGLDSTTVAFSLHAKGTDVSPLFFDYGQHCVETEWNRVNEVLPVGMRRPERVNLSDLFRGSKSRLIVEADLWKDEVRDDHLYIPYRTLVFYAAAAARAQTLGILEVYTGFINSNHAKEIDCTADFMNKLDGLTDVIGQCDLHHHLDTLQRQMSSVRQFDWEYPSVGHSPAKRLADCRVELAQTASSG